MNRNHYQTFPALQEISVAKNIRTIIHAPPTTTSTLSSSSNKIVQRVNDVIDAINLDTHTDTDCLEIEQIETPKKRIEIQFPSPNLQETRSNSQKSNDIVDDTNLEKHTTAASLIRVKHVETPKRRIKSISQSKDYLNTQSFNNHTQTLGVDFNNYNVQSTPAKSSASRKLEFGIKLG